MRFTIATGQVASAIYQIRNGNICAVVAGLSGEKESERPGRFELLHRSEHFNDIFDFIYGQKMRRFAING